MSSQGVCHLRPSDGMGKAGIRGWVRHSDLSWGPLLPEEWSEAGAPKNGRVRTVRLLAGRDAEASGTQIRKGQKDKQ